MYLIAHKHKCRWTLSLQYIQLMNTTADGRKRYRAFELIDKTADGRDRYRTL